MPVNENQTMLFSQWLNSLDPKLRDELANQREKFALVREAFRQGIRLQRPPSQRPFAVLLDVLKKNMANSQGNKDKLLSGDTKDLMEQEPGVFYNRVTGQILNLQLAEKQIRELTEQIEVAQMYSKRFDLPEE